MTDVDALLAGVKAEPADVMPKLALADELEAQGESLRVEWWRGMAGRSDRPGRLRVSHLNIECETILIGRESPEIGQLSFPPHLVMMEPLAVFMSQSQLLRRWLAESPYALSEVVRGRNIGHGLPDSIRGCQIHVYSQSYDTGQVLQVTNNGECIATATEQDVLACQWAGPEDERLVHCLRPFFNDIGRQGPDARLCCPAIWSPAF